MSQYSLISVVIPAYNCSATIFYTLQSLLTQSYGGELEIVVVDDGSTDKTPEVIKSFKEARYFRQENAGPASARNTGARESRGEIIFFTDSDCIPEKDWIEKMLKGFFRPDIGVVAGSYGLANGENILARGIHAEIMFRHEHLMPSFPRAFGSYNFCVKRDVFEKAHGFDTAYRFASGEDNDLSYKILKQGQKIYFERSGRVKHFHTSKFFKYLKEQFRHGYWRVKMYADHPSMVKGDDYTYWKDMLEVLAVGLIGLWAVAAFFAYEHFVFLFFSALIAFFIFEVAYGMRITKKIFDGIYFGLVMFSRAFARTAGFSTGIVVFPFNKIIKKITKKV